MWALERDCTLDLLNSVGGMWHVAEAVFAQAIRKLQVVCQLEQRHRLCCNSPGRQIASLAACTPHAPLERLQLLNCCILCGTLLKVQTT